MFGQEYMIVAGATTLIAFGGFMAGVGGVETVQQITNDPKPYSLELVTLDYYDGYFHQLVLPVGDVDVLTAKWSAKIVRNGEIICSGGDSAPYEKRAANNPSKMTAAVWTGQPGCEAKIGDTAIAAWEYKNLHGLVVTISGEHVITRL